MSFPRAALKEGIDTNAVTFVSVNNFGRRAKASPVTVREWIRRGMPACRVDRHWRIDLEAALAWMRTATKSETGEDVAPAVAATKVAGASLARRTVPTREKNGRRQKRGES